MKTTTTLLFIFILPFFCFSQVNEINFNSQLFSNTSAPRTNISPMSIKLLDNYANGGPTAYGTVLEIYGKYNHQTSQLYFGGWDSSKIRYREAMYGETAWNNWITILDSKNDVESAGNLKITGNTNSYILNGNVGIGTTIPTAKFEITGGSVTTSLANINGTVSQRINMANPAVSLSLGYVNSDNPFIQAYNNSILIPNNLILNPFSGKVGIGTTTPDKELTVNGTIHSKEVIVDTAIAPDYVFQKYYTGKSELNSDYVMPTLDEVESFTKKNNHLPNVPSAKEMQKNGMSLGEMNNLLLQKVEELTLYAIEQQKKSEEQNRTIETQTKTLEALATRLNNLEKK